MEHGRTKYFPFALGECKAFKHERVLWESTWHWGDQLHRHLQLVGVPMNTAWSQCRNWLWNSARTMATFVICTGTCADVCESRGWVLISLAQAYVIVQPQRTIYKKRQRWMRGQANAGANVISCLVRSRHMWGKVVTEVHSVTTWGKHLPPCSRVTFLYPHHHFKSTHHMMVSHVVFSMK